MAQKPKIPTTLLAFFSFFVVFLALRLYNLNGFLYFIYDLGRDMAKWSDILAGDITLIGPTTGLPGLFLGPLWYYVGLPGFVLSGGSPVGQSVYLILLSALAFPGFWWLKEQLFDQQKKEKENVSEKKLSQFLGWLCLVLFIIVPGSIISSTMIWNPLLAAPMMIGALFAFWKVRHTERKLLWLGLGFLLIGLTLQSEFAYAIFFLPVLGLAIPWMMQRFKIVDFLVAGSSVAVTLIPQALFEIRHQFLMTTSLFHGLSDSSKNVSWMQQFANRPMQLIDVTVDFFNGPDQNIWLFRGIILAMCAAGIFSVWQENRQKNQPTNLYLKKLLVMFALIPYPFYLLWRGNDGNFFAYYVTPHFVFIVPLFVLGLEYIGQQLWRRETWGKLTTGILTTAILLPIVVASTQHWLGTIGNPVNQAGLTAMTTAVAEAYKLQAPQDSATLVLTPNIYSVHYDYLFRWYGKQHDLQPPRTVHQDTDTQRIFVIEQWGPEMSDYVKDQRKRLTTGWTRKRVVNSGMVTVEEWTK
jgi:hypothetical protein